MKDKIQVAVERIQSVYDKFGDAIFSGHSGGKDSSVVLHLAQQVNPNIKVIHNVKPLREDSILLGKTDVDINTLAFMYKYTVNNCYALTLVPSFNMEEYVMSHNLRCQIDGTRADEFSRENKSSNFILNGIETSRDKITDFVEYGLFGLSFCYPIYDWSSSDVFDYHKLHNIPLSKEYDNDPEYIKWKENNE